MERPLLKTFFLFQRSEFVKFWGCAGENLSKYNDKKMLFSRQYQKEDSLVCVGDIIFGGKNAVMVAGPCTVESEDQTLKIAESVQKNGAQILRGGAYKSRTSPYDFSGLEEDGLVILAKAREKTGLKFITEVLDAADVPLVAEYADMLQIGARNMGNSILLRKVAKTNKPILLKRGSSATLEELLFSAEYLLSSGAKNVVCCERGIRTFGTHARFSLDISIIPAFKALSHLPIIVDPSHSAGKRKNGISHALAGLAAGADGLIVEVHNKPEKALCDGLQALLPTDFKNLMCLSRKICKVLGKTIGT